MHIAVICLLCLNVAGFASMGIDKRRAVRHRWRISERTLFVIALLGGSIGSISGMLLFHHKTRRLRFRIGLPLILLVQLLLLFLSVRP